MYFDSFNREDYISKIKDEDKIEITKSAKVPKGEYCDWCQEQSSRFQPYFNSWNDEFQRGEFYGWCQFYNERLMVDENDKCCNPRKKKCLACLMATDKKYDTAGLFFVLGLMNKRLEEAENEEERQKLGNLFKDSATQCVERIINNLNDIKE